MTQGGWDYNWIGEFGEKDNFRWDVVNQTGNRSSQLNIGSSGKGQILFNILQTFVQVQLYLSSISSL